MIEISVCMIVKNEEAVLARCLDAAKEFADELVIVDTGSSDRTKAIAYSYTENVYDFVWCDDFSAARNFAFSKATKPYVMWLDADDVIDDENIAAILKLKADADGKIDYYYFRYHISFDACGQPTFTYYRERLMRNCPLARFCDPVHEAVPPFGKTAYTEAAVRHHKLRPAAPGRNLTIYERYKKAGGVFSPRMLYYYGRELMQNGRTKKAIKVFTTFLNEGRGWAENEIAACKDLSWCYLQLGDEHAALLALFRSFTYAPPRADCLCDIAGMFEKKGRLNDAAHWYAAALALPPLGETLAFVQPDCCGFIPAINLSVIYYRLGDYEKAVHYNGIAGSYKPNHASYLHNKSFYGKLMMKN